ncbi:WYL domain-containing protein [Escherichia coli]
MSILNVLSDAMLSQKKVNFNYKDKEFRAVEPYRLVNDNGLWYLAAAHDSTLKSFVISSVKDVCMSNIAFRIIPEINEKNRKRQMVSGIAKTLSKFSFQFPHMLLRGLPTVIYCPGQEIIHTSRSGDLLVISRVTHTDQIMPLMKYWIPDVEVIQPA